MWLVTKIEENKWNKKKKYYLSYDRIISFNPVVGNIATKGDNMIEDKEYHDIVDNILKHKEFIKLKDYKHHGLTRYDHVVRVSYWSYKIAKKLRLDYKSVARAGLLHDFFFVNNQAITLGERIKVFCNHPKLALENSKKYFDINNNRW